jgi:sulfate/thiosulfate transport system substrate-binding protein
MAVLIRKLRRNAAVRIAGAALLVAGLAGGVAACGSSNDEATGAAAGGSSSGSTDLNLVAYSDPETVYTKGLIPAFQQTSQGSGVSFKTSFAASGDQSRAVEAGQPADVVHFALDTDVQRLVDDGIVDPSWNQTEPNNGYVQDSVVVFIVRKGNPDNIHDWSDLVKPGVDVVVPNPFSSGGARWDLMAGYGAQLQEGKSPAQALDYLKQLFDNTSVQPASASDALATFTQGKGDVLLSYESAAITAQNAGEDIDYVVPKDDILIETPIAVTKDAPPQASDFVKWLFTPQAQQIWADDGYRPVLKSVLDKNKSKFPAPSDLFEITDIDPAGWDKIATEFFDPTNGSIAGIERDLGVPTSG